MSLKRKMMLGQSSSQEILELVGKRKLLEIEKDRSRPVSIDDEDEDLIGNAADRAYLDSLPEMEREAILYERAAKKEAAKETKYFRDKLKQREMQAQVSSKKRSSAFDSESEEGEESDFSEDNYEEEAEYNEKFVKRTNFKNTLMETKKQLAKAVAKEEAPFLWLSFEECKSICLQRSKLENILYNPNFKDIICGCFVRVNIGLSSGQSSYKLAVVSDVVPSKNVYTLSDSLLCNNSLQLSIGKSLRQFRLDLVSNSIPTLKEFEDWKKVLSDQGAKEHFISSVKAKEILKRYENLIKKPLTEEAITEMINLKKSLYGHSSNTTAEKLTLERKRDEALAEGNIETAKELDQKIKELLAVSKMDNLEASKLEKVNERNRSMNSVSVRSAELRFKQKSKENTDSNLDPCARRKCLPSALLVLPSSTEITAQETPSSQNDENFADDSTFDSSEVIEDPAKQNIPSSIGAIHSSIEIDIDI